MNQRQRKEALDILSAVAKVLPQLRRTVEAVDDSGFDLHWEKLAEHDDMLFAFLTNLSVRLEKINKEILEND